MNKELLKEIVEDWGKAEVYYVGGCVRDLLLGIEPKDYDLCVDLENGATLFTDFLKSEYSKVCSGFTVFPKYGTAKFDFLGEQIECVMPRRESYNDGPRKPDRVSYAGIYEDALRRDFCCNALYMNIKTGEILDPTGKGREDVKNKILRTPINGEETFKDDPLRMLRAFRFAAVKGFKISEEVLETIKDYPEYYELSMERVWSEFSKILVCSKPGDTIRELHQYHLLSYIIPELEESWGFDQNSKYHNLNLTDHILKVLDNCKPDLTIRTAALLHDISKYKDYQIKEDGRYSYHGHEKSSAEMSRVILSRLRCSSDFIDSVSKIIESHMIIKQCGAEYRGSRRLTRRIMRELGDLLEPTLNLIDADNNAHSPEYCLVGQVDRFRECVEKEKIIPKPLFSPVSGRTIMECLGIEEGRKVGEIKELMQSWYDEDPSLSEEDLIRKYNDITV